MSINNPEIEEDLHETYVYDELKINLERINYPYLDILLSFDIYGHLNSSL